MSEAYARWTHRLYLYFTQNVPPGGEVYLSVDHEVLAELGPRIFEEEALNWEEHFLNTVKKFIFKDGQFKPKRLLYKWLKNENGKVICPAAVGYLAALVLAAHKMQRDEEAGETAYYIRLRRILGLPDGQGGRPSQLKSGSIDQELWEQWNAWIDAEGWLSTASGGQGSHRYISYPISQALLRDGDKARLEREFQEQLQLGALRRNWDQEHLAHWLSRSRRIGKKVASILESPGSTRYNALVEAIYDVYISINRQHKSKGTGMLQLERLGSNRNISAGLYRYMHPIKETVRYFPYPRQPKRGIMSDSLDLENKQGKEITHKERSGWYAPLQQSIQNPADSAEWHINNLSGFEKLILPGSDFWILVKDPDAPESDKWATWHRPQPGEHFMLLCKADYLSEMERLRSLKLVDWEDYFEVDNLTGDWLEFENCMVINLDWEGVFAERSDLFDALYPHMQISVSLAGGLKAPGYNGWLANYPPEVRITGVNTSLDVSIYRFGDTEANLSKESIFEAPIETNTEIDFPARIPGRYLIEAYHPRLGYRARRSVILRDWSELTPIETESQTLNTVLSDKHLMQGAWIGAEQ